MKTATRLSTFSALTAAMLLLGAGCISFGAPAGSGGGADGGMFKSTDKGDNWAQKAAIPSVDGQVRNFGNAAVSTIVQDPQDPNALYIGTADNGIFYTYDAGESWRQPPALNRGRVWSVAVHPKNKCILYATTANKLAKSEDCGRSWTVPYLDSRPNVITKQVAIDTYNPNNVWLGLSSGDLLLSKDGGDSWSNNHSFGDEIREMTVSSTDTRRLFVATAKFGIFRTDDQGANWLNLGENYHKQFKGSSDFLDMAVGVSSPEVIIFASKYGLLRSRDFGDTWASIDLLTPPGQALIYSVAIDPKSADNIYYGTATTFNKTANGGTNWITKRLPTTRAATAMYVDRSNSGIVWMGATKFK